MPSTSNTSWTTAEQTLLLQTARQSIEYGLQKHCMRDINATAYSTRLQLPAATFVTLKIAGQLRGCIGTTSAVAPLVESVNNNAYRAAFHDPRFQPLHAAEFPGLYVEIAILTAAVALEFSSEAGLLAQLRPAIDGLIIAKGDRRATFLPAVWESLPDKKDFLNHLKHKAGINLSDMPEQAWCYQSIKITEQAAMAAEATGGFQRP